MAFNNQKLTGAFLFISVIQVILFQVICQTVYPNYNAGNQAISDMGNWNLAGNFAAVFNISAILLGLLMVAGVYYFRRGLANRPFASLLTLVGVCNIGLGIVSEELIPSAHGLLFLVMSVCWVAAAVYSSRLVKAPFSYLSAGLGAVSLVAFILSLLGKFGGSVFVLGFGLGGLERLTVYPLWLWTLGFGAYLMGSSDTEVPIGKE
jgi:hypothetical membrane protein